MPPSGTRPQFGPGAPPPVEHSVPSVEPMATSMVATLPSWYGTWLGAEADWPHGYTYPDPAARWHWSGHCHAAVHQQPRRSAPPDPADRARIELRSVARGVPAQRSPLPPRQLRSRPRTAHARARSSPGWAQGRSALIRSATFSAFHICWPAWLWQLVHQMPFHAGVVGHVGLQPLTHRVQVARRLRTVDVLHRVGVHVTADEAAAVGIAVVQSA